jgi:hypothetical protein
VCVCVRKEAMYGLCVVGIERVRVILLCVRWCTSQVLICTYSFLRAHSIEFVTESWMFVREFCVCERETGGEREFICQVV